MVDIMKLTAAEARRWAAMHIDPRRKSEFIAVAKRLVAPAAKARYLAVQAKTGVPWWLIAVIHEREASQRWDRQLGQGDPLNERSRHVPAGRGPFSTWEDGAYDALMNSAPKLGRRKITTIGEALEGAEEYNGLGYAMRGVPAPYDWSGTDQYSSGKYVADHVYSASAVDRQLGCAALLACMAELDHDIHFDIATAPVPVAPVGSRAPVPTAHVLLNSVKPGAPKESVWVSIGNLLSKVFNVVPATRTS